MKLDRFALGIQTIVSAGNLRMPGNEELAIWYKQVKFMDTEIFFVGVDEILKGEESLKNANIVNLLIRVYNGIRKDRQRAAPRPETGLTQKKQRAWGRSIRLQLAQTSFAKKNGLPTPQPLEQPNMSLLDDKIYGAEFAKVDYHWPPRETKKRSEQNESVLDGLL